jgi:hypothetical protein
MRAPISFPSQGRHCISPDENTATQPDQNTLIITSILHREPRAHRVIIEGREGPLLADPGLSGQHSIWPSRKISQSVTNGSRKRRFDKCTACVAYLATNGSARTFISSTASAVFTNVTRVSRSVSPDISIGLSDPARDYPVSTKRDTFPRLIFQS